MLQLHYSCLDADLGHLVCVGSDGGRDAEKHFDMFPHLLWDLVEQCRAHGTQLQLDNTSTQEREGLNHWQPLTFFLDLVKENEIRVPVVTSMHTVVTTPLTWSSCLLKLLKMSCLLTWKTGFPSLKTACMTTPSEYMSEAESQLTDRMYSGARYSGLGRQSGGWLGSHSLHAYLGCRGRENMFRLHKTRRLVHLTACLASGTNLSIWGVGGWDAKVKAHDLPRSALVEDDVFWTQVAMDHFHSTVQKRQTFRDLDGK